MKKIILLLITLFSITTLLAQKKHTVKIGGLYEHFSFFNTNSSDGASASYNYQFNSRYSINTRLGWTKGTLRPYIDGADNFSKDEYDLYDTETTKFAEITLKYRLFPHFVPKNKLELGIGATLMALKYNYMEESLVKGIYLFYLRKNTINVYPILYHAMFQDKYQITDRWSVYTNVVFRLTRNQLPGYYVSSRTINTSGSFSANYSSTAAHYARNFIFELGVGYSF